MTTLERTSHSARKARTQKLISLGGLVAKAKLDDWNANTLLGAFLSLKDKETDHLQIETWTYKGDKAFSKEKSSSLSLNLITQTPIALNPSHFKGEGQT